MSPALREKIAQFLDQQGVFEKKAFSAASLKGLGAKAKALAKANRGKIGLGLGAGAVGGMAALGDKEQDAQSEAAELNQLLEAYPELLYTTPPTSYEPEGATMGYPGTY